MGVGIEDRGGFIKVNLQHVFCLRQDRHTGQGTFQTKYKGNGTSHIESPLTPLFESTRPSANKPERDRTFCSSTPLCAQVYSRRITERKRCNIYKYNTPERILPTVDFKSTPSQRSLQTNFNLWILKSAEDDGVSLDSHRGRGGRRGSGELPRQGLLLTGEPAGVKDAAGRGREGVF